YSIYTAVAMAANGAGGLTLEEMLEVLGFPGEKVLALNKTLKALDETLIGKDPATVFQTANSVWYNTLDFNLYPKFTDRMADWFDASVEGRDFSNPATLPEINGWVNEHTNGKIDRILDRINRDDVCFLINALYFNGKWSTVFDREMTHKGYFTDVNGKISEVPTMYLEERVGVIRNEHYEAVELPYGDGSWAMYLFLPAKGTGTDALVADHLKPEWDAIRSRFEVVKTEVYLPQFRVESSFELSEQLASAGMPTAFTGQADFSELGPGSLAISQVLHKTFIDVNEEGTEAAAVTAVVITRTSVPDSVIRLNRPFVFLIAEKTTGSIIFMGQITKL
ncbi:MAG: serpin family protein, partial [Bacteroidales bacterium]